MYFRADKRHFVVGDQIESAGQFQNLNPDGSDLIEEAFDALRPAEKRPRIGSLFLFIDEAAAKRHWSKMTGGCLYAVDAVEVGSTHRGDMRFVDQARELRNDKSALAKLAQDYWSGALSSSPIIEVLVQQATVVQVLSNDQSERIAYFKSWALA